MGAKKLPRMALSRGWPTRIRSAMQHVIVLAQHGTPSHTSRCESTSIPTSLLGRLGGQFVDADIRPGTNRERPKHWYNGIGPSFPSIASSREEP